MCRAHQAYYTFTTDSNRGSKAATAWSKHLLPLNAEVKNGWMVTPFPTRLCRVRKKNFILSFVCRLPQGVSHPFLSEDGNRLIFRKVFEFCIFKNWMIGKVHNLRFSINVGLHYSLSFSTWFYSPLHDYDWDDSPEIDITSDYLDPVRFNGLTI